MRDRIVALILEGKTYKEIREITGAANGTISYHAKRLGNPNRPQESPETNAAIKMIRDHRSNPEIVAATNLSLTTICKLRKKAGISSAVAWTKENWLEFQQLYDTGQSIGQCCKHFQIALNTAYRAKNQGYLVFRSKKIIEYDTVLIKSSTYNRGSLKRRLIADGILAYECSDCGVGPEWNGRKLTLSLDHINGVNDDHRIENLRFLCPNCHSQTDTFAGRNTKRSRMKCLELSTSTL